MCIYQQSGAKLGRVYSSLELETKRWHLEQFGKRAEIGIASFLDTIPEIEERRKGTAKTAHRGSIKMGKVGRPIKRRKSEHKL